MEDASHTKQSSSDIMESVQSHCEDGDLVCREQEEEEWSPILPLLSSANFERWYKGGTGYKTEWEKIGVDMYTDESVVPAGLRFLWKFMRDHRVDHYGPKLTYDSAVVGDLLAYGAFATIHVSKKHDNWICKISRFGSRKEIDNEKAILSKLQHDHIPTVIDEERDVTNINVGRYKIVIPTLTLAPRGKSVEKVIHAMRNSCTVGTLETIGSDIKSALDHIHKKGIFHCDVSIKNIIMCSDRAYLIDFGIAKTGKDKHRGFQGTIAFAHRSIFAAYPDKEWSPQAHHDVSSLGLAMTALKNIAFPSIQQRRRGRIPWDLPTNAKLTKKEISDYHKRRLKCVEGISGRKSTWYKWASGKSPEEKALGSRIKESLRSWRKKPRLVGSGCTVE